MAKNFVKLNFSRAQLLDVVKRFSQVNAAYSQLAASTINSPISQLKQSKSTQPKNNYTKQSPLSIIWKMKLSENASARPMEHQLAKDQRHKSNQLQKKHYLRVSKPPVRINNLMDILSLNAAYAVTKSKDYFENSKRVLHLPKKKESMPPAITSIVKRHRQPYGPPSPYQLQKTPTLVPQSSQDSQNSQNSQNSQSSQNSKLRPEKFVKAAPQKILNEEAKKIQKEREQKLKFLCKMCNVKKWQLGLKEIPRLDQNYW